MGSRVKRKKASQTRPAASRHSRPDNDRLIASVACILLAGIVWIAFGQTVHYDFVSYDDGSYVYANPRITSGLSLGNVQWAFTHVHAGNWHPLTTISHMLDCQLYGLQPWGHHLTNILLQAGAAILLFFALCELTGRARPPGAPKARGRAAMRPYQVGASAFVAALFAIHPLRVESVAWVAERKDVLSGVFFMLTLLAYARYAGRVGPLGRPDGAARRPYLATLVFFALGLMCKPTVVTLPFVLLLLDYWPLRRTQKLASASAPLRRQAAAWLHRSSWPRLVAEKIPLFLLSAASCVVTILAQREAFNLAGTLTLQERFANAVVAYVEYVGQMVWPTHLAVLYPYPQGGLNVAEVIVAFLFLLIVSVIFFLWRNSYPFALVGWLWFLGMLVPMIGIVQVGYQPMADRYTYLPQIGLYILVTWGAMELFRDWRPKREVLAIAALLIIGALITRSYFQASSWRNSETLWRHAIDVTHDNYIAYNNLGVAFLENGQVDEAIAHYKKAVAIKPESGDYQYNLGNALARKGNWAEAITCYQAALNTESDSFKAAKIRNNLGAALEKLGRFDEALEQFSRAVELNGNYPEAQCNLGQMLARRGRRDEAVAHLREAVRLKPGYEAARKQLRELGVTVAP
jgi:Flp pilus assembly protein TadD